VRRPAAVEPLAPVAEDPLAARHDGHRGVVEVHEVLQRVGGAHGAADPAPSSSFTTGVTNAAGMIVDLSFALLARRDPV